ncbi:hypothetical protein D3C75_1038750 [compost metagenome]
MVCHGSPCWLFSAAFSTPSARAFSSPCIFSRLANRWLRRLASGFSRKWAIALCAPATGCSRETISENSRKAFIARNGVRANTSSGL